jgi:hypothetical protein
MAITKYEKRKEGNLKDLQEKLKEVLEDAGANGDFASLVCNREVSKESTLRGRGRGRRGRAERIVLPLWQSARAHAQQESEVAIEATEQKGSIGGSHGLYHDH